MDTLTHPSSLSISLPPISGRKLPIKRKRPPSPSSTNPHSNRSSNPSHEEEEEEEEETRRPPFKFHRIWTEIDELRFLQGLLHCRTQGLFFPRDLNIFYSHFSCSMPQPYSRSQLSEKLRRLRKKFRVVSSRLSRGLQPSQLSSHDRALFDLSLKLWHPDNSPISPFGRKIKNREQSSSVLGYGFGCGISPVVPFICDSMDEGDGGGIGNVSPSCDEGRGDGWRGDSDLNFGKDCGVDGDLNFGKDCGVDGDLNEVKIEEDGGLKDDFCGRFRCVIVRSVLQVFDACVGEIMKEYGGVELGKTGEGLFEESKMVDFQRRWREQQISEVDVLCGRLRLVVEDAIVHR